MIVLDTDILIDLLRKHPPAIAWVKSLKEPLATTGYSALELYQGCRNTDEAQVVSSMLSRIRLLWAREEDCLHALSFSPLHAYLIRWAY